MRNIVNEIDLALGHYRVLERKINSIVVGADLTIDSWRVLLAVVREDSASMSTIVETTQLPPASATRATDFLVTQGFVFRKMSLTDRRIVQVMASEEGVSTLKRINSEIAEKVVALKY